MLTITRSYALGDIILTSAFIENVRLANSKQDITFRTNPFMLDWFALAPYDVVGLDSPIIGEHINLDKVVEQYEDYLITKHENKNRVQLMCDVANITCHTKIPEFYITDSEMEFVSSRYEKRVIGVSPSSKVNSKTFGFDAWRKLIPQLTKICDEVLVFDTVKNFERLYEPDWENTTCSGYYDIRTQTLYAMACDVMITHDSLWCHIANAVGTPQLLFTSCTDSDLILQGTTGNFAPKNPQACYPCWYRYGSGCSNQNAGACYDNIRLDVIVDLVKNFMRSGKWEEDVADNLWQNP